MQITEEAKGTKVLLSKAVKTLLAKIRAAPATGRRTGAQHRINKGTRTKESKDDTYPAGIHSVCAHRVAHAKAPGNAKCAANRRYARCPRRSHLQGGTAVTENP